LICNTAVVVHWGSTVWLTG